MRVDEFCDSVSKRESVEGKVQLVCINDKTLGRIKSCHRVTYEENYQQ